MSGPIRVLRVIARLNVGGPALHVSYLASDLDPLGYETTLAAGSVGAGEGTMEYVARARGVEPVLIRGLQREISPVADVASVRRVLRLIRQIRPHVLHTHTAKAGAVGRMAALLAGKDRPKAVVHTYHGHVLRGYFSPPVAAAFTQVERQLSRVTDALVAVSPQVRDDLARLGVVDPARVAVIRLGLDLEARTAAPPDARTSVRATLGLPPDALLVGWLGRMTEIKRVDDLLRAFALLARECPDAFLALVGDGPLRRQMDELAGHLGIADRCRFVGYQEDVAPFYAAFDAVVLTSGNEGTPVTLIEALAAGVPVVATDVGGVPDVVEDGVCGLLVPPADPAAVAGALSRLASDRELRRRLGASGRRFVSDRYSVPRLVRDIDLLYRSLLEQADAKVARRSLSAPLVPALTREARSRIAPAPRRLRILLLSQYFPPEVGATQSRMQTFAEYLAARGHEVTVIAEFPNHPIGVFPPQYRGRVVEDDRSNGYRVLRVWVKTNPDKTTATRMEFYLSYTGLAVAVGPRAGRADVVVATSPPLFTGIAGAALASFNGAPLILDIRDLWPAAADALDQITGRSITAAALALERWLYREAAVVLAVTRPFCEHVDAIRGSRPRSVHVPNGTLELFLDAAGTDDGARGAIGVGEDAFLVTFAGTHGIAQALPRVLDAASEAPEVHFAFVGEGPVKDRLVADAASRSLANVHFLPQVRLADVPPLLAASDALLVPLSGHDVFADFVPSKLIDFMAVGKPVILSAKGEAARLLSVAGGGVVVAPEDGAALAGAARRLAASPDEAAEMGRRGREFARRRLRGVQAERLEQVLFDATRR